MTWLRIPSLALAAVLMTAHLGRDAAALDAGAGPAAAKPPAAKRTAAPPRSPDAILADAAAATGGDAPWQAHRSMEVTTEIEYRKMAMSATRTQVTTSKNKSLS